MKLSFKQMMSFVLLCASALSLSCSKQDFSLPSDCAEQSQNSSEERGVTRLAFYSRSTLDKAILNGQNVDSYGNKLLTTAFDRQDTRALGGDTVTCDFSDLVPEEEFARLLNGQGEIQVGDTIYRITSSGTYYCAKEDYKDLLRLVNEHRSSDSEVLVAPNLYRSGNVYRYDTFGVSSACEGVEKPDVLMNTYDLADNGTHPVSETRASGHAGPDIGSFESVPGKRHTWAGKLFQGVGVRYSHTIHLANTSHYRLNCALFDYNYVIHQAIGVSGKIEHKMWYGGWAKVSSWPALDLMVGHRWMILKFPWGPGMKYKETYDTIWKDNSGLFPYHPDGNKEYCFVAKKVGDSSRINTSYFPLLSKSKPEPSEIIYCADLFMNEVARNYMLATGKSIPFPLFDIDNPSSYNHNQGLSRLLDYFRTTVPIFGKDGVYVVFGPVYNVNAFDENAITLKPIHKGIDGFRVSFNVPLGGNGSVADVFKSLKISDVLNADVELVSGDFYACGYYNGAWRGYRLYW